MKKLEYLVLSTGRSGSVFLAKWLTAVGIPCGHESIFTPNGLEEAFKRLSNPVLIENSKTSLETGKWLENPQDIVADSSYMAVPFLDYFKNTKKIHILRHPISVIRSFFHDGGFFTKPYPVLSPWEDFIFEHVPVLKQDIHPVLRTCLYYIEWSKKIKDVDFVYKLEDDISALAKWLTVKYCPGVSTKTNTWKKNKFGSSFGLENIPDGLIKDEFVKVGHSQGYDMNFKEKSVLL